MSPIQSRSSRHNQNRTRAAHKHNSQTKIQLAKAYPLDSVVVLDLDSCKGGQSAINKLNPFNMRHKFINNTPKAN